MVTNTKQTALAELEFWNKFKLKKKDGKTEELKLFLCLIYCIMHQAKKIYHSKAKASINMHKVSGDLAVFGTGP
jgi:hypothetical protein